jgi:hypothetical protein
MQLRALHLKLTGIVQATGALLGILSAIIYPDGGHPSLAVLIGLVVIPLNLFLALVQIVTALFLFTRPSLREVVERESFWGYIVAGWFLTAAFVSWQWPPLFF